MSGCAQDSREYGIYADPKGRTEIIAYVFWHSRDGRTPTTEYEQALVAFHEALNANRPSGFIRSQSFHIQQARWIDGDAYEDWYLLDDTAALETLGHGAVSGEMSKPHDGVAMMASFGIAGLYKPAVDDPAGLDAATAVWFAKPVGMSYSSMHSKLRTNQAGFGGRLWQRMLTLGPTAEICLLGGGRDLLPFGWESVMVVRRPVTGNQ